MLKIVSTIENDYKVNLCGGGLDMATHTQAITSVNVLFSSGPKMAALNKIYLERLSPERIELDLSRPAEPMCSITEII